MQKIKSDRRQKYLNLEKELRTLDIGQDAARFQLSAELFVAINRHPNWQTPHWFFYVLRPTARRLGKTELAKAWQKFSFDDESPWIRFDMSEYMEKFAASRLNGAPPGYVGYEEGGELTEKVRNRPYSVLLFDEVERSSRYFQCPCQVLDDGQLTPDSKAARWILPIPSLS